jgi:hypothetical protein
MQLLVLLQFTNQFDNHTNKNLCFYQKVRQDVLTKTTIPQIDFQAVVLKFGLPISRRNHL